MSEQTIPIPGRLKNVAIGGHVAGSEDIDAGEGKTQKQVNDETNATLALHQSEINGLNSQNYVSVSSYSSLPATGSADTIYRVSSWDGNANSGEGAADVTKYTEYAWNGTAYIVISVKTQIGEVFDISEYKAVGGTLATFENLSAALDNGNNVPVGVRKGGMSIKFVQSSDNKYVRYTLLDQTFTTNIYYWRKDNDEPMAESDVSSVLAITRGGIDSSGNYTDIQRKAMSGYLRAPFEISVNDGYLAYQLIKYSCTVNGEISFNSRSDFPASGKVEDTSYIYRVIFCKPDYTTAIPSSEYSSIVASFKGKVDSFMLKTNDSINRIVYKQTDLTRISLLPYTGDSDKLFLKLGGYKSSGYYDTNDRATTINSIAAPFKMSANSGYVFYKLARFSIDNNADESFIDVIPTSSDEVTDTTYVYRPIFCKSDYSSIISQEELSNICQFTGSVSYVNSLANEALYNSSYLKKWGEFESFICWQSTYDYKYEERYDCRLIPVEGGDIVTIDANSTQMFYFTIVKSFVKPINDNVSTQYDLATEETQRRDVYANGTLTVTVPSDAKYLLCSYHVNNVDATPTSFRINGYDILNRQEVLELKQSDSDIINTIKGIYTSTKSSLEFMQGEINSSGEVVNINSRAVTKNYIDGAFKIIANSGYIVYKVARYRRTITGEYTYVDTIQLTADGIQPNREYSCRVTFCKSDYRSAISSSEYNSMVAEFSAGIIFNYEKIGELNNKFSNEITGENKYNFKKNVLFAEKEGEIIPYTRGVLNDSEVYDTSKRYERLNLLFMTDSHIDMGNTYASRRNVIDAIDFANELKVPIAAILEGGDVTTNIRTTKAEGLADLESFFNFGWNANMPLLYTKGNHDINTIDVPPSDMFTDDDWGTVWYDRAETQYGIVRNTKSNGKKSGYYYYDLDSWKVRIVALNCFDIDYSKVDDDGDILYKGGTSFWFSQEQLTWFINEALDFDDKNEKDWGVIVFTHFYRATDTDGTSIAPIFTSPFPIFNNLVAAFNTSSTYNYTYTFVDDSFFDLNLSADWTRYANLEKKPFFIGILSGHLHADGNDVINGINNIRTANQFCGESVADIKVKRVAYTKTQNLFDVVNIDLKRRKIRYIRYGAGINCNGVGGNRFLPDGISF